MIRRLFTILSVLSLAVCVAVVVLWVRTHAAPSRSDVVLYLGENFFAGAYSHAGTLILELNRDLGSSGPLDLGFQAGSGDGWTIAYLTRAVLTRNRAGALGAGTFGAVAGQHPYRRGSLLAAMVPHWFAALLSAGFPIVLIWSRFRGPRNLPPPRGRFPVTPNDPRASPSTDG